MKKKVSCTFCPRDFGIERFIQWGVLYEFAFPTLALETSNASKQVHNCIIQTFENASIKIYWVTS